MVSLPLQPPGGPGDGVADHLAARDDGGPQHEHGLDRRLAEIADAVKQGQQDHAGEAQADGGAPPPGPFVGFLSGLIETLPPPETGPEAAPLWNPGITKIKLEPID